MCSVKSTWMLVFTHSWYERQVQTPRQMLIPCINYSNLWYAQCILNCLFRQYWSWSTCEVYQSTEPCKEFSWNKLAPCCNQACIRVAHSRWNSSRTSTFYQSSWSFFSRACAGHHDRSPTHNQWIPQPPADTALYGNLSSKCCTFHCCRSGRSCQCFNRSRLKYCCAFNSLPANLFAEFSGHGEALERHLR